MCINNWIISLTALKDPFAIIREDNVSSNPIIKENAASAYQLFFVIGVIGLTLTFIISGIRLAWNKDSSKKSDIKTNLGIKTLVAIIFFSFITLIGIIYRIILWLT